MTKKIDVGYIRVSTIDQNTDRQLDGLSLDRTYTDKASGKSADRPGLQRLIDDAELLGALKAQLFVHSLDRLARNLDDLRQIVRKLTGAGMTVHFVKENLTFSAETTNPLNNLMLNILGAFAEFERTLIRERQREGIAIAKAKGVYTGRKRSLTDDQIEAARRRIAAGEFKSDVAHDLGISRKSLYNYMSRG